PDPLGSVSQDPDPDPLNQIFLDPDPLNQIFQDPDLDLLSPKKSIRPIPSGLFTVRLKDHIHRFM
uniref:Reverse transcriptase domain-containing protein n=1 Tax=Romanomermis culicivorax TaxID=13658 RepID=A0A915IZ02_ROMCU